ncbi:MAG: NifU family protein [Alphaproteobacteria bacterium]|nr:NifU family protein [Alphaproteobacteria bacterium]
MFIETERTPNPATLKFLPGCNVMEQGTRDFASPAEAQGVPLAENLLSIDYVTGVFFGRDFISVSIRNEHEWDHVKPEIMSLLLDHFASGHSLFETRAHDTHNEYIVAAKPEDQDIIDQIRNLIETRVRPAVAQDGGDIVFRGYANATVYLAMQGACSGCPSSTATLKHGIESLLKHYVPEVEHVLAV